MDLRLTRFSFPDQIRKVLRYKINKNTVMKKIVLAIFIVVTCSAANAQFKLNTKTISAARKAATAVTFSDADAAAYAKQGVDWMDAHNPVAAPADPYAIRLNKLFAAHQSEDGLALNFKVYKVTDINAFACADGSVRVFSSLMDMLTDDELLAVIGHEIGHVKNKDTRDAIKASYTRAAGKDLLASQSGVAAALTESQLGQLAEGLMNSSHSRGQESDADDFSYAFMKKHGYNVMGAYTAFLKLAKLSEGGPQQTKLEKMMSSHPDSKQRAEAIERKAKQDGFWKESKQ
jgi:putative metalloprotease